jgi:DNA-binding MarR family transcriptional regulator
MFDHRETLFHAVAQLSRRLNAALRDALAPLGLQPAQFAALTEIAGNEGITQAHLAERLDVEQPGVARTLAGLEKDRLISRKSLGKGRAQGLYLTEAARALLPQAAQRVMAADRAVAHSLSRTEAMQLIDDLGLLAGEIPR